MLSSTSQFYREKTSLELSIIVPVYNAAEKIPTALDKIKTAIEDCGQTYEIIVVNDGSTDQTLLVLEDHKEMNPTIRVLTYANNVGKGHAVKTGILECRGSKCLFIDGDLDISPRRIQDYFAELENSDLVVASKRHKLSVVSASKSRKFLSHSFSIFVRLVTGISVKDTQSGLKAGKSSALKNIFSSMNVSRYAFDVELLMMAANAGLKIKEMPVELKLYDNFKFREIVKMTSDVLRIAYRHRIKRQISDKRFKLD
jgi:glycosyltransferase involved in cell wall biosynthesis